MDLSSMLEREDFFSFFFSTVEKYYMEALGEEISFSFAKDRKSCNMIIKPQLSAATSIHMSPKARTFFYSEWNIRNSIIKNIIAKTYVFLLTRTGRLFSQFQFIMLPETMVNDDVVIAPNNRSIRIFDYGNQTVGCIVKEGFTRKFFDNQLEFRKNYNYDFMVPLISYGDDWFREPIMFGHPLARTTDEQAYNKGLIDALAAISRLASDTYVEKSVSEYILPLLQKAEMLAREAKNRKQIRTLDETLQILNAISDRIVKITCLIPTCISHGDLQSGNIWVDETGKTIVYDWETVDRRSVWYDASVLQYSLRRHEGWSGFFELQTPEKALAADKRKHYTIEEYGAIKCVVLLEDILFYLEDMLELPEKWGADLYDAFIDRLMKIDKISKKRGE